MQLTGVRHNTAYSMQPAFCTESAAGLACWCIPTISRGVPERLGTVRQTVGLVSTTFPSGISPPPP